MSALRILQVTCTVVLASLVMSENYDDQLKVTFSDYYNEINEAEQSEVTAPTETPCTSREHTKWDKLFTMLENSQMKENMLLQYSDDIVKVGLESLRAEVLEIIAQNSGTCATDAENSARRTSVHIEEKLLEAVSSLHEAMARHQAQYDVMLQEILKSTGARLDRMEKNCINAQLQSVQTSDEGNEDRGQLQSPQKKVSHCVEATAGQILPAGCDMALFFPMRSTKMQAEMIPDRSMKTRALTLCMWIKPTETLNKTVLFSYGTASNPMELQLLLSGRSALFAVGAEESLVEVHDAVTKGLWVHLCGTWSSEQGMASLWVDGHRAASSPDVAKGHEISDEGFTILGQKYTGEGLAKRFGFQETFNANVGFTGKLTGVNVWDRVLEDGEILEQAQENGSSCGSRGNLVAWGVSQIMERGGVKLIY
ncbi:pentraxin-related protein PTX3 [Clarias gariepinus]|uniref:pentraxin-related protein PTX3 n=1 Tax=Clarias gariepinus TaxID=13013 RepID=UPI00234C2D5E|nr:pentraxin-related protein PTX3 [Clarias gariepinus]